MDYEILKYSKDYLHEICDIWNEAIDEGLTLLWKEPFEEGKIEYIISTQTECFYAVSGGKCIGFYILHPISSGRGGHIANALYIVKRQFRLQGIGTALVNHSMQNAKEHNFLAMQYSSVVASNVSIGIYNKLGFEKSGLIPDGFCKSENQFEDLLILYKRL
ncbi:MAG TPA: N-acetyltransferase [Clostridiales bacterium]|nr:N-acetyltransferase [Clostridiales bacterium]